MNQKLKICLLLLVWGVFALPAVAQTSELDVLISEIGLSMQKKDREATLNKLDKAIKQFPKERMLYTLRFIILADIEKLSTNYFLTLPNKDYYLALKDLEVMATLPDTSNQMFMSVPVLLMSIQFMNQQYAEALKSAQVVEKIAIERKNTEFIFGSKTIIMSCLYHTNQSEKAKKLGLEILKDFPDKTDIYSALGMCYGETGEFEKAYIYFEKGMQKSDTESQKRHFQMNYIYIYTLAGKYKEALALSNELLENTNHDEPKGNIARCYSNRGYAKMNLGNIEEALQDINKSLELYPENSYAFRNRGLLHLKMGKKDLACADFQKAEEYGYSKSYGNEVKDLLKEHCK